MSIRRPIRFRIVLCLATWIAATVGEMRHCLAATEDISFPTRIVPILTKAGCNAGACHGAATGQGGFKLSLLGYDPEDDFERITRELSGRRIDLTAPAESLFLRKPTRQTDHEGGRRIAQNSASYRTLLDWIKAGAPYGPSDLRVTRIEVMPGDSLLNATGQALQLRVRAFLSDGSAEDVTELALYNSNDDAVAEASKTGEITARGRGLTSIMVRYGGQVAAARVAIPFDDLEFADADFPAHNLIDEHVRAELKRLRIRPSPLSGDAEFLRRVFLDLTGCLPTGDEARILSDAPGGLEWRQRVIDDLLIRDQFVDFWTMKFADLLLISGRRGSETSSRTYHNWLREQIATSAPFDQMARALLTAQGEMAAVGPASFFALANDPRDMAEHVGRIFLGTQIACARCHAHPADRWTQEDYHRFAAYFARVSTEAQVVKISQRGEVDHPKTGQPLAARPLGSPERAPKSQPPAGDRRLELADWITSPDNLLFSRTIVNRVWKHLLGRGLVEPVDDLRPTNPATHPALLDQLADEFVRFGYDLRRLIRTIVTSRTYQLSSRSQGLNRLDDRFYSHAFLKDLPAQVFLDAIAQATAVPHRFEGYSEGTRAVQLIGSSTPSYALDVLGRCTRERACDVPGRSGGGLAQALHLINGETINGRLGGGVIEQLLARDFSDREIIEELYLRTLTRRPEPFEIAEWERLLAVATNKNHAVADLLWTLLNSREFAFNH